MTDWIIKPSYKYDLANVCNLMTGDPTYTERHSEAYAFFASRFDPSLVEQVKGAFIQGILLGPGISSILSCSDYDGCELEPILAAFDVAATLPFYAPYVSQFPLCISLLQHIHSLGAYEYWRENCLPALEQECQNMRSEAEQYPVVEAANKLLGEGYTKSSTTIQLYLAHFAAPHGTSLNSQAFLSDLRFGLKKQVEIAVHEMLHPPFEREEIRRLSPDFWADPFFKEAKSRLPVSSGYPQPADFLEENLVEAAHIYLSEQLGVIDNPLEYFIKHDQGTHVISPIVFDALKQGVRERCNNLKEAVHLMIEQGLLTPGKLREQYCAIYNRAGIKHPYQ